MYELIKANQLDLMLILCGACGILVLLLINTRFLSRRRKAVLILMEVMAVLLLWSDRLTYIYTGDTSHTGYIMVRLSNFLVFFLTSGMVLGFNMYLADLLNIEGGLEVMPKRLHLTRVLALTGMALAVISAFTDLYYYFDEANRYHRGNGFLIAYIIPLLGPILQYTV
nr:diguanylate cyclase [Lachnospiraceae bacterium]